MFITKDSPMRTPSAKSVTEKPEYSKCKKRPIKIPRARDIPPIAIIFSSLSSIPSPCLLTIFTFGFKIFHLFLEQHRAFVSFVFGATTSWNA